VIGAVGASASFLKGRKTIYLVQDQDTVALQRPYDPANPSAASFEWEFHPILGQHYVKSGLTQTFVQVALPLPYIYDCFGAI
jgi:hypothetical protein